MPTLQAVEIVLRDPVTNERIVVETARLIDIQNLQDTVDNNLTPVPHFQQAAQVVLFSKSNTRTYPQTMNALRSADDARIAAGDYVGLGEGAKAALLIQDTLQ